MNEKRLKVGDGFAIQKEDLLFWNKILRPEFYKRLERRVIEENDKLTKDSDGYDVFRGGQIDNVVANFRYS